MLGTAAGYPVHVATVGPDTGKLVWVNAGTHGDEPAGVEAALAFLERAEVVPDVRVIVTPCLNPWGYVAGRRENRDGVDVNWAFSRVDVEEVALIRKLIEGRRFGAVIDLHEDWESPGYYVYEQFSDRSIGHRIIERVRPVCRVNEAETIEGERADGGVIHPRMDVEKRKSGDGVPVEVFRRASDRQITAESPTGRPMGERVAAHLAAIEVILEEAA